MARLAAAFFSYAASLVAMVYAIAFVGGFAVPKTVDTAGAAPGAVWIDLALVALFALQHSIMARRAFKRWWTRIVPPSLERSTYVLASSLVLGFLFWQWRGLPGQVWHVANPVAAAALWIVFAAGWAIAFLSTFLINHFEMFGLLQARHAGRPLPPPVFVTPLFYRLVRHPLYAGMLLAFWSTPDMRAGHLLFATATTAYILIGVQFEEYDLVSVFGDRYRSYREQVGMLLPRLVRTKAVEETRRRRPF